MIAPFVGRQLWESAGPSITHSLQCGFGGGPGCPYSWAFHTSEAIFVTLAVTVIGFVLIGPYASKWHSKSPVLIGDQLWWSPPLGMSNQRNKSVHTWASQAPARAWAFPVDGIWLTATALLATVVGISCWVISNTAINHAQSLRDAGPLLIVFAALAWFARRSLLAGRGYRTGTPHLLITSLTSVTWMISFGIIRATGIGGGSTFAPGWLGVAPLAFILAVVGSSLLSRSGEAAARSLEGAAELSISNESSSSTFRFAQIDPQGYLVRPLHNDQPSSFAGLIHPVQGIPSNLPMRVGTNLLIVSPSAETASRRVLAPGVVTRTGPTIVVSSGHDMARLLAPIVVAQGSKAFLWDPVAGHGLPPFCTPVSWDYLAGIIDARSALTFSSEIMESARYQLGHRTTARHAPTRHAPASHAPTRHAPASHAPARHAPASHAPTDQTQGSELQSAIAAVILASQFSGRSAKTASQWLALGPESWSEAADILASGADIEAKALGQRLTKILSGESSWLDETGELILLMGSKALDLSTDDQTSNKEALHIPQFVSSTGDVLFISWSDESSIQTGAIVQTSLISRVVALQASRHVRIAPLQIIVDELTRHVVRQDLNVILQASASWGVGWTASTTNPGELVRYHPAATGPHHPGGVDPLALWASRMNLGAGGAGGTGGTGGGAGGGGGTGGTGGGVSAPSVSDPAGRAELVTSPGHTCIEVLVPDFSDDPWRQVTAAAVKLAR